MITAIVLNYNDSSTTISLVKNIEKYKTIDKIIIVDNCSTDNSFEALSNERFDTKVIIVPAEKNGGYGYGNNIGIRIAKERFKSDYIIICNPDVVFSEETIVELSNVLSRNKDYSILSPQMIDAGGNRVSCYWNIPTFLEYTLYYLYFIGKIIRKNDCTPKMSEEIITTECVAGSFLFCRTDDIYEFAQYDESIFLYCEETVQGIKLKSAGKKVGILPDLTFIHNHSVSINKSIPKEISRYKLQWKSRLYVLQKYYNIKGIKLLLAKTIMKICILEKNALSRK